MENLEKDSKHVVYHVKIDYSTEDTTWTPYTVFFTHEDTNTTLYKHFDNLVDAIRLFQEITRFHHYRIKFEEILDTLLTQYKMDRC